MASRPAPAAMPPPMIPPTRPRWAGSLEAPLPRQVACYRGLHGTWLELDAGLAIPQRDCRVPSRPARKRMCSCTARQGT